MFDPILHGEREIDALRQLQEAYTLASLTERPKIRKLMDRLARGYRTNRFLSEAFPTVHRKQRWWLKNEELEVLYGGSAGGGKTIAMLMSAIQYADQPGYSGILFRRTFPELTAEGGLMDVARRVLTGKARWSASERSWFFPKGGRVTFGYMDHEDQKYRYQGHEFSFIGWDELTQYPLGCYTYLFSRLRRRAEIISPLRVRASTNPGGAYGEWVLERFIPNEYIAATEAMQNSRPWFKSADCDQCGGAGWINRVMCDRCSGFGIQRRWFIPSRLTDNPSLDQNAYRASLANLGHVEAQQLEHGRWDITAQGNLFLADWVRTYSRRGDSIVVRTNTPDQPVNELLVTSENLVRIITADTASTDKNYSDWNVICVWQLDIQRRWLFLEHIYREKLQTPQVLEAMREQIRLYRPVETIIENKSSGIGVIQSLIQAGINVRPFNPGDASKIARSVVAQVMMKPLPGSNVSKIWFPAAQIPHLRECLAEMLSFPVGANDDFVDNLSMAAWYASEGLSRHPGRLELPGRC